jgi:putative glutamine amidotransferase
VPLWADDHDWAASLAQLATVDGLMLTGGADIDPVIYQGDAQKCEALDPERDRREVEALRFARERLLPTLGICRGMQLMNVCLGEPGQKGSLLPDIEQEPVRHRANSDGSSSFHSVEVYPGTKLASILGGSGTYRVNSRHHQGLREQHLAAGLRIAAVSRDGIVEGVEAPSDWALFGVQCHPERRGEAPEFERVIAALIAIAAERD